MSLTAYGYLLLFLLIAELIYLKLARHFRLFDLPNQRSMHQDTTTVWGGGIIVYLAVLAVVVTGWFNQSYFFWGLTLVVVISFLDDIHPVPAQYRLMIQIVAVGLLLAQTGFFPSVWWAVPGLLVLGVGVLNVVNFMDGINGMTALHSIVTIGTLWYLTENAALPGSSVLYPSVLVALLIFGFFNVRARAVCFAGDVGSLGVGFVVLCGLLTLTNEYHSYLPILLLAVYGTDSMLTIRQRIRQHQPLLRAHRQHLYQRLVSQRGWPHRRVALVYALVQAGVNVLITRSLGWSAGGQFLVAGLVLGLLFLVYTVVERQ